MVTVSWLSRVMPNMFTQACIYGHFSGVSLTDALLNSPVCPGQCTTYVQPSIATDTLNSLRCHAIRVFRKTRYHFAFYSLTAQTQPPRNAKSTLVFVNVLCQRKSFQLGED
ncbi:hypothetical protein DPX39_110097100 [Trypanosoma brucei equiperdum]|uniref:Uncharacterized protein n=1 Tax=Trypanosoma brucei equiperdum TaxID=630700 RepID=A0A3L6KYG3_9TRYP|nr:hypothetical protein DPX39_110097100 [Trypanosoma brucei equiperdum]